MAIGGTISQSGSVVIRGNKNAIPEFSIPFIGLFTSAQSLATLHFIIELFSILLFVVLLFLVLFFRKQHLQDHATSILSSWRGALLYIFFSVIIIPVLIFFLFTSIIGVMIIPLIFLCIMVISYYGFLASMIRLGKFFLRKGSDSFSHLFLCGFIGLVVLKGPVFIGIFFSLLELDITAAIGTFLIFIGSIAMFVVYIYGFGATLIQLRERG